MQLRINSGGQASGSVRRETENGTEYLVADATIAREGVLSYEDQRDAFDHELLPAEEFTPASRWNGLPVLVDHPTTAVAGTVQPASTTTPGTSSTDVGEFRDAGTGSGGTTLGGEVWIRANERDQHGPGFKRAFDQLEDGDEVQVSPGYGVGELDATSGRHNGESYSGVQRDLDPDHVAVVISGKARCSVEAGCSIGQRANAEQDGDVPTAAFGEPLTERANSTTMSDDTLPEQDKGRVAGALETLGSAFGIGVETTPHERENATQYDEGTVVEYGDGTGVVLAVMTADFTWPQGDDDEVDVEASSDSPMYVVARESGGSGVYEASELSSGSFDEDEPDLDDLRENAVVPEWYGELEDPFDYDEIHDVVRGNANIPGVDDPEVGFSPGKPEGWTRKSYLQAYASLGGSWRSCVTEMTGDVRSPKRWCSALKDTVFGTERWRGGRFNARENSTESDEPADTGAVDSGRTTTETDSQDIMHDPESPNDLTDDQMIDYLAEETEFDRENAEKLRGEDCLALTYDRFNSESGDEEGEGGNEEDENENEENESEEDGDEDRENAGETDETDGTEPAVSFESEEDFHNAVGDVIEQRENAQKEQSLIDWIDSRSERFNAESLEGTPQPVLEEIADDVADDRENAHVPGQDAPPQRQADRGPMRTGGPIRANADDDGADAAVAGNPWGGDRENAEEEADD